MTKATKKGAADRPGKMVPFSIHLKDIARHPKGPGDGSPKDLVLGCLALVVDIAKKAWRPPGVEFEDVVQAGYVGLVQATKKYDPARGAFSTYATYWIRQAIRRYLERSPWAPVSTPSHAAQLHNRRVRGLPIPEDKREVVEAVERARKVAIPLSVAGDDGDRFDFPDLCAPDPNALDAGESIRMRVAAALTGLTERERFVLEQRFAEKPRTLEQLGSELGLTKERVRQIEAKALVQLRRILGIAHAFGVAGGEG